MTIIMTPRSQPGGSPVAPASPALNRAVVRLADWLETMHGPGGYGGPVAHWWQQSWIYTGPGLDWRYEGIIAGYLHLWERTGQENWCARACRAGDDLCRGQLADGHYPASAFEINPATAGTPHEAAADLALLLLASALQRAERAGWERYLRVAERNLHAFYIDQLWDPAARAFRDSPSIPSFVPNKAATACEALFLLTAITGDAQWAERYALPTLDRLLDHQVVTPGSLHGAIAQNSFGVRRIEKYFPIYIARCVGGLLAGYRWSGQEKYLAGALRAMLFITRQVADDGSLPTVVYPNQRTNRYPSWIAPLGDVLRAAEELRPFGFDTDLTVTQEWLYRGQDASGGIQTATGFAAQAGGRPPALPDVRDVLHVVGWCDKAFRYLAAQATPDLLAEVNAPYAVECTFQGQRLRMLETADTLEFAGAHGVCYRWRKDTIWPECATPAFWIR